MYGYQLAPRNVAFSSGVVVMNLTLTIPRIVERERKKAEKQAKFDQKKAALANATPTTTSKSKEKKAKAEKKAEEEVLPPYIEETPAGEKKSTLKLFLQ